MKAFIKNNLQSGLFSSIVLWLMIWGGYNTGIERVLSPGFPHNFSDLIHGIRAFFPILAGLLAVLLLLFKKREISKKFFLTPMGMLMIYAVFGIIFSVFSPSPLISLYWGVSFISVIVVLLATFKNLPGIVYTNWLVAIILTLLLLFLFFSHIGVIQSLTLESFFCNARPYETLGGVGAGIDTFGMAGTRPTGWGRYTGLSALVCLAMAVFKNKKSKIIWSGLFLIFLLILLFSRGKTELIAFSAAAAIFLFLFKKYKMSLIFFAMLLFFVISIFVFHTPNLLCSDRVLSSISAIKLNIVSADQTNINLDTTIKEIITLSGRTNGIWRNAWDYFKKSPLIGHGFHSDRLSFGHTHNTLLQALVQSGLLGAIFFVFALAFAVLMLLNLLKSGYLLGSEKIFFAGLIGVLLFFFIRGITESFAYFSADWIFVAPIIAYIQYLYQRIRSENKQKKLDFCGFKIDAVKMPEVLEKINYWVKNETHKHHWIIVTGMHGVVEASKYADFKYVLSQADLWVPDGISLVWLAQSKGFNIKERVSGADLMQEVLKKDYKNFLYGDKEETLLVVKNKFPNSKIDFYPPPFRELTPEEDEKIIEKINSTKPDILWVGLGLPKQEKWIYRHKDRLNAPVIIGVGAAFKFLAGTKKRAPKWMGSIGLEWLWRLLTEPKVVWKRVFIDMPYFFWLVVKDLFF